MADVLRHPWCAEGLAPETMLRCNGAFVARSLAAAPSPCTLAEVRALLAEAACGPATCQPCAKASEGCPTPVRLSSASDASEGCVERRAWGGPSIASLSTSHNQH